MQVTITTEKRGWFKWYAIASVPAIPRYSFQLGPFWSAKRAQRQMQKEVDSSIWRIR